MMLSVEAIEAGYGGAKVLQGVDFELGEGEALALLGRNGMGKTTTVRALFGLLPLRAGRIVVRRRRPERPAALCHRARRPRPRARGAPGVPDPHGRREPRRDGGGAPGPRTLDADRGVPPLPAPRRASPQLRRPTLRRRATDARHRARADDQSQAHRAGRGDRRARSAHPRGNLGLPEAPQGRGSIDPGDRQEPQGPPRLRRPRRRDREGAHRLARLGRRVPFGALRLSNAFFMSAALPRPPFLEVA